MYIRDFMDAPDFACFHTIKLVFGKDSNKELLFGLSNIFGFNKLYSMLQKVDCSSISITPLKIHDMGFEKKPDQPISNKMARYHYRMLTVIIADESIYDKLYILFETDKNGIRGNPLLDCYRYTDTKFDIITHMPERVHYVFGEENIPKHILPASVFNDLYDDIAEVRIENDSNTISMLVNPTENVKRIFNGIKNILADGIPLENRTVINDAAALIDIAKTEGIDITKDEAELILGYFEGHDYCLVVDEAGKISRHSVERDDYLFDDPYSIKDAIEFCRDMNEDLLATQKESEDYIKSLREDEKKLDVLFDKITKEEL